MLDLLLCLSNLFVRGLKQDLVVQGSNWTTTLVTKKSVLSLMRD